MLGSLAEFHRSTKGQQFRSTLHHWRGHEAHADDAIRAKLPGLGHHAVLCLLASGLSKKEIAAKLTRSVKTIENHCSNLMKKLDVHDRVALARYAIREGYVKP